MTMHASFFAFGQQRPEYAVPVLNERAVRAAAGLLFLLAMIAFMNAWLTGNFAPTRVIVVAFLIDFGLRLLVNPRYAPSLVIGQWLVRHQQPEWTGAPQKRFAWSIGFLLALTMLYLVVIQGVVGPVNLLVCGLCLLMLFFETAFGICIGCWLYNRWRPEQAQLCPGNTCVYTPDPQDRLGAGQVLALLLFAGVMAITTPGLAGKGAVQHHRVSPVSSGNFGSATDPAEEARCRVPDFAKAMGHEEKWKLHNNCP